MEKGQPSRTAFAAAMYRAGHQLADRPVLFEDPLAVPILGMPESALLEHFLIKRVGMRSHIVARQLLAEETLARAYERGVRQYVVLGAGFDTFAYRNPNEGLKVFEVDFPTSQAWKRQRLAEAGIDAKGAVYAPIDFETETLRAALARAGFDLAQPAVFAWLGVLMYLTGEAVKATFTAVAGLAKGTEIVFDYGEPTENAPAHMAAAVAETRQRVAEMGEPILSTFQPAEMARLLTDCGFAEVEDLSGETTNARFFKRGSLGMPPGSVAHQVRARV
jgi:methyltransferase (TIGR00027 family)